MSAELKAQLKGHAVAFPLTMLFVWTVWGGDMLWPAVAYVTSGSLTALGCMLIERSLARKP